MLLATLQSVVNDLEGRVDYEIILVDNFGADAVRHGVTNGPEWALEDNQMTDSLREIYFSRRRPMDSVHNCSEHIEYLIKQEHIPRIKLYHVTEKLSCWGARNAGVMAASSPVILFLDAHCIVHPTGGRISDVFWIWQKLKPGATLHLPHENFLVPGGGRIYRMIHNLDLGLLHFEAIQLDSIDWWGGPVPCMSICGAMCERKTITDTIDFWPKELGPYGGGEHYLSFLLGTLGKEMHVLPWRPIAHFAAMPPGERWCRDFRITYPEWAENIMIATFLIGGQDFLKTLTKNWKHLPKSHPVYCSEKHFPDSLERIEQQIIETGSLQKRRRRIAQRQTVSLSEFVNKWKDSPLATEWEPE